VPKARSGELTKATELTPVTISGMVVIAAMSTIPIHIRPIPVFSAMASPYRARLVPANRMMTRQERNLNQTKAAQSYYTGCRHTKHPANRATYDIMTSRTKER
jgi:hypothetical protein